MSDTELLQCKLNIVGHTDGVLSASYSPDGKLVTPKFFFFFFFWLNHTRLLLLPTTVPSKFAIRNLVLKLRATSSFPV